MTHDTVQGNRIIFLTLSLSLKYKTLETFHGIILLRLIQELGFSLIKHLRQDEYFTFSFAFCWNLDI